MRKVTWAVVVGALLMSVVHVPAALAGVAEPTYYVALGDSLSVGFQPNRGETAHGYVDVLTGRVRRDLIPDLRLKNVGCAGETSRSLISGKRSPCRYPAGSQLDAAVKFLDEHPGQVAFITIDIGANDITNRCLRPSLLIRRSCARDLAPALSDRVTAIVEALASAAGPGVPIVGMTYYNPFLGLWGLVPGGRALAHADQRAWVVFNEALATAYEGAGAAVAGVAERFRIEDFDDTVVVPDRGRIPVNVALACRWTWFCSERFPGDPHANRTGYRRIAGTFQRELGPLLETSRGAVAIAS
ncbi:MAG TPA: SGNH/GDSL hydrolase family protein [Actinomycetota bacterium]|nr:SGNH/GDSL hydrolase family protein [Actinomycetota bacterium]